MRLELLNDWNDELKEEFSKPYFLDLMDYLEQEYKTQTVFPPKDDIVNAFAFTPLHKVKVVVIGQDPYHDEGQAHGLSFSVQENVPLPKSLKNIFKELSEDIGCEVPTCGNLEPWARQGVLLLNTVLTVRANEAGSHQKKGWEQFTDAAIKAVNRQERPIVFILWGRPAQEKMKYLTNDKHLVISSPHPSPLSAYRGFFGSKPFSRANEFLVEHKEKPIEWRIPIN